MVFSPITSARARAFDWSWPCKRLPSAYWRFHTFIALALLAVIIGSFPPGIVPLALARVHELVPNHHRQQLAWSRATVSFATFQAVAGFAYSALFNASGGHHALLFLISAGAILFALMLDFPFVTEKHP